MFIFLSPLESFSHVFIHFFFNALPHAEEQQAKPQRRMLPEQNGWHGRHPVEAYLYDVHLFCGTRSTQRSAEFSLPQGMLHRSRARERKKLALVFYRIAMVCAKCAISSFHRSLQRVRCGEACAW